MGKYWLVSMFCWVLRPRVREELRMSKSEKALLTVVAVVVAEVEVCSCVLAPGKVFRFCLELDCLAELCCGQGGRAGIVVCLLGWDDIHVTLLTFLFLSLKVLAEAWSFPRDFSSSAMKDGSSLGRVDETVGVSAGGRASWGWCDTPAMWKDIWAASLDTGG